MRTLDLPPRIFVAGTGTGVGKTMVSAILAAGLSARYWKPIQSGLLEKNGYGMGAGDDRSAVNAFFP